MSEQDVQLDWVNLDLAGRPPVWSNIIKLFVDFENGLQSRAAPQVPEIDVHLEIWMEKQNRTKQVLDWWL